MTDAHGIYIPDDLISRDFDDDWSPEYSDTEAPTGGAVVYMLASMLVAILGAGWLLWKIIH